jgi:hypothetical protein
LLFVSTDLTGCYSFRLFYFVLCGDFNFVYFYSMVETNDNIVVGMYCVFLSSVGLINGLSIVVRGCF